jgi:predicted dehydrogenase
LKVPSKSEKVCRWAFLSTAGIAKKNWRAIAVSDNSTLVAVASRSLRSAEAFIADCQRQYPQSEIPAAVEGYDEVLQRPDIDAVYIPLPTALRGEWIRKAIEAGKHVLAEKPAGIDASEVRTLVDLAKARGVQYMDGVMFMHSARMKKLREVLDDGTSIGKLKRIATHFSFLGDEAFKKSNIRTMSQYEPYGCVGDLAWYNVRLILWAKRYEMPSYVVGRTLTTLQGDGSPSTVPGEFSGELVYNDGFSASFYCSFLTENQQWAHLSGERGNVTIRDFVLPHYGCASAFQVSQAIFEAQGCDFHMKEDLQQHSVVEYSEGRMGAQEVEMIRCFAELAMSRKTDSSWGEITWATQRVLDALIESASHSSRTIMLK